MADDLVLAEDERALARAWAPEWYLAAALAPRRAQADLVALSLFLADTERILATVADPAIAEIRLQWWRDAVRAAGTGVLTGHPAADRFVATVVGCGLDTAALDAHLDARVADLYADPVADRQEFDAHLDAIDGVTLRLAARILARHGHASGDGRLLVPAATAIGLARIVRRLPIFLHRGRSPFPQVDAADTAALRAATDAARDRARAAVAEARALWRMAGPAERAACLPLALVEPYLRVSVCAGNDPGKAITDLTPLSRMWHLWKAHALGRV